MPKIPKYPRIERIQIRLTVEEHEKLKELSRIKKLSKTEIIANCINDLAYNNMIVIE